MKDTEIKQKYSAPECESFDVAIEQSVMSPETGGNEGTGEEPIG